MLHWTFPSFTKKCSTAKKLAIGDALSDTVKVTLLINNEGIISVKEVEMSEKTKELLPSLGELLMSETENFSSYYSA